MGEEPSFYCGEELFRPFHLLWVDLGTSPPGWHCQCVVKSTSCLSFLLLRRAFGSRIIGAVFVVGPVFVTVAARKASQSMNSSHNSKQRQLLENNGMDIFLKTENGQQWKESPRPRQYSNRNKKLYLPLLGWGKKWSHGHVREQRNTPRRRLTVDHGPWTVDPGTATEPPPHTFHSPGAASLWIGSSSLRGGEAEPHSGGFNSHRFAVDSHGGVQIDPPLRRRKTRSSLINSTGPLLHIRLLRSHFLPLPSTLRVGATWPGLHFGSYNR